MVSVYFTKDGILTTASLEISKTVTAKWYTETCLPQLFENLVSRAPLDSWFLHHDNAPAHQAFATQEFLEGMEVQLLEHPRCTLEIPYNEIPCNKASLIQARHGSPQRTEDRPLFPHYYGMKRARI